MIQCYHLYNKSYGEEPLNHSAVCISVYFEMSISMFMSLFKLPTSFAFSCQFELGCTLPSPFRMWIKTKSAWFMSASISSRWSSMASQRLCSLLTLWWVAFNTGLLCTKLVTDLTAPGLAMKELPIQYKWIYLCDKKNHLNVVKVIYCGHYMFIWLNKMTIKGRQKQPINPVASTVKWLQISCRHVIAFKISKIHVASEMIDCTICGRIWILGINLSGHRRESLWVV